MAEASEGPRRSSTSQARGARRERATSERSSGGDRTEPLRRVGVVCLPDAGGPALAEALRHAAADGAVGVSLYVVGAQVDRSPMLIGDPLTGVFWPVPSSRGEPAAAGAACDADADADAELRRRARQLWWLCWEMGFDAECEPVGGGALDMMLEAIGSGCDLVVLAGSDARRWRPTVRELTRRAHGAGLEVRVARDRQAGPLMRWLAR